MPLKQCWVPSISVHTLGTRASWLDPLNSWQHRFALIQQDLTKLLCKNGLKPTSKFARVSGSGNQSCSGAFYAEVWLRGQQLGQGKGRSIKAAAVPQMVALSDERGGAIILA